MIVMTDVIPVPEPVAPGLDRAAVWGSLLAADDALPFARRIQDERRGAQA